MRGKRRSARLGVALPVRWLRRDGVQELLALDVNQHGMFLATDDLKPPGSLMQLEVLLPDGPLRMFVTVRFAGQSISGVGMGVELFVVETRQLERWFAFYRELTRQERDVQSSLA